MNWSAGKCIEYCMGNAIGLGGYGLNIYLLHLCQGIEYCMDCAIRLGGYRFNIPLMCALISQICYEHGLSAANSVLKPWTHKDPQVT